MASSLEKVDQFYDKLQTLPGLIGKLGLSVAEAQRRLDQDYAQSLTEFLKALSVTLGRDPAAEEYKSLFKQFAPSRYQFTETVAEVRTDLQMTSLDEFSVGAEVGVKASIFAVTVNASYTRRSAYDYRASAVIRSVLNAIPANEDVLDKLLERGGDPPKAELPSAERYKALAEAFEELMEMMEKKAPSSPPKSPPTSPPKSPPSRPQISPP